MKLKILFTLFTSLALFGCASQKIDHGAYLQAQVTLASNPTLTVDCPSGCQVSYTDPRDKQISVPHVTNGYDAAIAVGDRLIGAATSMAPWYGVTRLGIEGIQAVRDSKGPTHIGDNVGADKIGEYTGPVRGDTVGGAQHQGDYAGPVNRDTIGQDQYQGDKIDNSGDYQSPESVATTTTAPPDE